MDIAAWNRILGTNLTSVFFTCKLAIPYMLQRKSGKIINISSVWGRFNLCGLFWYAECAV